MSRFLILNADDFGLTPRVNAAVERAHREGVLTSASLMMGQQGFQEAVQIAKRNPKLGVGLHLTLSVDHALLPNAAIPHLTSGNGRFGRDPLRVGLLYALSSAAQRELELEMEAQFNAFAGSSLKWSHVDGHQHFHVHPAVWKKLIPLCKSYNVHRIRLPAENPVSHWKSGGDRPNLNTAAALFLNYLSQSARKYLLEIKEQFFFCDRVYGQMQSSNMNGRYLMNLLDRLEGQTNEAYFHPGTEYAKPLPHSQRREGVEDVEMAALLMPGIASRLEQRDIITGIYEEAELAKTNARIQLTVNR